MGVQYVENEWLESCHCGKCGITWAMPTVFLAARRQDGKTFYCPNGDPRVFRESSEDRLKKELERQRQITEAEQARAARIERERDQVARAHQRMRQRVMNGVCPCCNRTFQNLMQHMKTEHAADLNVGTLRQAFGMTQAAVADEAGVDPAHVSMYERGKPVVGWAKSALDGWVDRHASKAKTPA
jgi:DNA-binding XRE family transcriptional regulator